jgi:hypothetical protein
MVEALVLLSAAPDPDRAIRDGVAEYARVVQSFGPRVLIVDGEPPALARIGTSQGVLGVFTDEVPVTVEIPSDVAGSLAVAGWNERRRASRAATPRIGEGRPWDDPAFEPEGHPDVPDGDAPGQDLPRGST